MSLKYEERMRRTAAARGSMRGPVGEERAEDEEEEGDNEEEEEKDEDDEVEDNERW